MLPEIAHFALILALLTAVVQAGLCWPSARAYCAVRRACYAQIFLLSFSLLGLVIAFISNDFSVQYVASNSSRELPYWYQITALWGAHEGSMLLWATLFSGWSALAAVQGQRLVPAQHQLMLNILGLISVGFLSFIVCTSNPFLRLLPQIPLNGRDLNPLLQDPGFLIHPPMLYLGYVGCGIIYALLLANLIRREMTTASLQWLKPWALSAWGFLTLGITLGSWWSYRVLGWGGFWAWDPVENASLLPWLVLTAFIHSLLVSLKRQGVYAWTVLLGLLSFALSLLGTFLVRSGVLTSVHAFAVDPKRGIFILAFLCLVFALAFVLYALRIKHFQTKLKIHLFSRESAILANNFLLMTITLTILLGTLYPMLIDALGLGKLSVGAPYFNRVVIPLAVPFILLLGIGPLALWRVDNRALLWRQIKWPALLTVTLLLMLLFVERGLMLGLSCFTWIVVTTGQHLVPYRASRLGMVLAHLGVGVLVLGLTLNAHYAQQRYVLLSLNDSVDIASYQVRLAALEPVAELNYTATRATFDIYRRALKLGEISSDKRVYTVSHYPMSHPGIFAKFWGDIYIALGDEVAQHRWSVRVYYKPGIRFIWLGGLLMVCGGFCAIWRRREGDG
jgi:cytochrome c-type biogenesis protein CcmF